MKSKIFVTLGVVMLMVLSGCSKGKFCRCTSQEEIPDVRIVNVDWGISCKSISQMGIERQIMKEGDSVPTLVREKVDYICEHIKADSVDYDFEY